MQQAINLINKALEKAEQDLNNDKVDVNYTPEFIIGMLEKLKDTLVTKQNTDVYEIRKEYSNNMQEWWYIIYKNNHYAALALSIDLAKHKLEQIKRNANIEVVYREEVINE